MTQSSGPYGALHLVRAKKRPITDKLAKTGKIMHKTKAVVAMAILFKYNRNQERQSAKNGKDKRN